MKKTLIALGIAALMTMPVFAEWINIPNLAAVKNNSVSYARVGTTDSSDFYSYYNSRFGIHTYVPSFITKAFLPANSDGARFENDDGSVVFSVAGGYNYPERSINEYFAGAIKSFNSGSISFTSSGSNWYVVSGIKNGMVVYTKGLIIGDVRARMWFQYPEWDKDSYDWMVPILEEHFYLDGTHL